MIGWRFPDSELARLTAALCDGHIAPDEVDRLEQRVNRSAASRRWFNNYVQLHAELYWEHASAGREGLATPAAAEVRSPRRSTRGAALAVGSVAAAIVVGLTAWLWTQHRAALPVARIVSLSAAQWSDDAAAGREGQRLSVGQQLHLRHGRAELAFDAGILLVAEGPASLEVAGPRELLLHHGAVAVTVSPYAAGFTVRGDWVRVVDRGTRFAVARASERDFQVHVITGHVDVESTAGEYRQSLEGGQAVRLECDAGGRITATKQPADASRFVFSLERPSLAGSVARMRTLVAADPHLIHHYPFEGDTPLEKCRDRRGDLDLAEAVMVGGRGQGSVVYSQPGFDASSNAVRCVRVGNDSGVGLQSQAPFQPPAEMTVELLLNFQPGQGDLDGLIASAVATRADTRRCGFLVTAVDAGQLVQLLDGEAPWVENDFDLAAGRWYYVACTFRTHGDATVINTYLANLSRGERKLTHVLRDFKAPGGLPASRLGVGKGFNAELNHAYPWPGAIDEVAIYDRVLDAEELDAHLGCLTGENEAL